jgi:hypothetical protein
LAGWITATHTHEDIERTVRAMANAIGRLQADGIVK